MPGLSFLNKKNWHTGRYVNQEAVWLAEQSTKERIIDERAAIEEIQVKLAQPQLATDDNGKSEVRFLYECPNEKINQLDAMNKRSQEHGPIGEDPLVLEFRNKLENVSNAKEIKNVDQIEQIIEESTSRKKKKRRRHDSATDPLDYINEMLYTVDNDDFDDLDVGLIATLQKKKQKKLLKRLLEMEKVKDV